MLLLQIYSVSMCVIHLELTKDLGTSSFLQAFKQFTAHCKLPSNVLFYDAKIFKASSVNVQKIKQLAEVLTYLANKQVIWEFIVEKAPIGRILETEKSKVSSHV